MIKAHYLGRTVSSVISDVVIASVHSEKTHLKKLIIMKIMMMMMVMIMMNISQETTIFNVRQKLTSTL